MFAATPEIERDLRAAIAAEASCCAFLRWTCERTGDGLVLDIAGPAGRAADHRGAVRVSVPEKLLGAGALIMALCCARAAARRRRARRRPDRRRRHHRRRGRHASCSPASCTPSPAAVRPAVGDADRHRHRQRSVGKRLVRRLVEEVVNAGDLSVLDEIYTAPMARGRAPLDRAVPRPRSRISR